MKNTKEFSISRGNIKVKSHIWNIPAGKTCKQCLECQKYCYAKKAEIQYPAVLPSRTRNLKFSNTDKFVDAITEYVTAKKLPTFRIHESGDFYNESYITKWYAIIKACPKTKFYAYTKRDDLFTDDLLANKPKNLTLIFSIDGIVDDNYIADESILAKYDKIAVVTNKATNCPAQKNKEIKCMLECKKCINKTTKVIKFSKH